MKYIKVIPPPPPRNSCNGFRYRSRNFISANDSRDDVSGMEVSRRLKMGETVNRVVQARPTNDLHDPRSCMNQGWTRRLPRVMNIYESSFADFTCEISRREICQETNSHRFESTRAEGELLVHSYAWSSLIPQRFRSHLWNPPFTILTKFSM